MSGQKTSASSIKCGGFLDSERGFAYPENGRVLRRAALSPFKQRTGASTHPLRNQPKSTARECVSTPSRFSIQAGNHAAQYSASSKRRKPLRSGYGPLLYFLVVGAYIL